MFLSLLFHSKIKYETGKRLCKKKRKKRNRIVKRGFTAWHLCELYNSSKKEKPSNMGASTSALETAKLVRTLLCDEATPPESFVRLLNTPITDTDAFQAFPVEQLRQLRHLYTRNFSALLYRCIGAIAAVAVKRHDVNTSTSASGTILTAELMTQFHSALRILYHILPIALENGSTPLECGTEREGLQENDPPAATQDDSAQAGASPSPPLRHRTNATQNFQRLFFVQGSTCDDDKPEEVFPIMPRQNIHLSASNPHAKPLPLGSFLVWSLVECCFIRGLTLPEQAKQPAKPQLSVVHSEVDTGIMWCPGLASEDPISAFASTKGGPSFTWATPKLPAMRKRLLDVLFITLSSPVYHDAGFRDTIFLEPILSTASVPLMPTLAISMLNTILQFVPYGFLPYTSHLGVEERELVEISARTLDATLSYIGAPLESSSTPQCDTRHADAEGVSAASLASGHHGSRDCLEESEGAASTGALQRPMRSRQGSRRSLSGSPANESVHSQPSPDATNQRSSNSSTMAQSLTHGGPPRFVHSVRKALRDITITEAKAVVGRMQAILGVNAYASQTYLPTSQSRFESLDEFMLLFWKILDLSPTCLAQFGSCPCALDYVVPVLDYALEVRRSPFYVYRFQMMLFALARLSEVRGFVLKCNQVSTATLPFRFPKLPPNHTYNDLIVLALCVVMEMKDVTSLTPLFPSCTVILANMAPFITPLGRTPSIKLVSVFAHAAYRCLRNGASTRASPGSAADSSTSASSPSAAAEASVDVLHQSMMVNLCEAIASLLQYHPNTSLYVLASLVDHRAVVREVKEAYIVYKTKVLTGGFPLPFLINTLDAAVSVALPVVESTDALRKISKYYMDTTSPEAVSNATAALERTSAFVPPVGMGEHGVGLAASDVAIERLRTLSLVGVLPTPHSIVIRKFQSTKSIEHWTSTTFWTSAYIHAAPGSLGDRDSVKLVQFVNGRTGE